MAQYTQILRRLSPEAFAAIFGASSRRDREAYLHRHRIRAAGGRGMPQIAGRAHQKQALLRARLATVEDEEMCQELLRTWLLTRRPILCAALDHLQIPHEDGLTDSDEVSRLAELGGQALADLRAQLAPHAQDWEIDSYLAFMGVKLAPA